MYIWQRFLGFRLYQRSVDRTICVRNTNLVHCIHVEVAFKSTVISVVIFYLFSNENALIVCTHTHTHSRAKHMYRIPVWWCATGSVCFALLCFACLSARLLACLYIYVFCILLLHKLVLFVWERKRFFFFSSAHVLQNAQTHNSCAVQCWYGWIDAYVAGEGIHEKFPFVLYSFNITFLFFMFFLSVYG